MRSCFVTIVLSASMLSTPAAAWAQERPTVLLSDTHMGLGSRADGSWHPQEDFRWSNALRGFLDAMAARYPGDDVDVVVLGDFLELWQRPDDLPCSTPEPELSCTTPEMVALAQAVVQAHRADLVSLGNYVARGTNRLYIVPGNHDAALMIPEVRQVLLDAFPDAARDRVEIEADGEWTSVDGHIVTEHGHQIGQDVNKYDDWPRVTETDAAGVTHLIRPWGENFVQTLFNEEESRYPLIDNLGPESAGLRYRIADRGWVRTARDFARFIAFNLFETSFRQKLDVLGQPGSSTVPTQPRELGHRLVLGALPVDDPMAARINEQSVEGTELRAQLDALVSAMSDTEVAQLCDHAALQGRIDCAAPTLSSVAQGLVTTNEAVLRAHLRKRSETHEDMRFYVYGHTHKFEVPWDLTVRPGNIFRVANTGAFQRVIDEAGFEQRRIARGLDHSEALRGLTLDDLPACYTYITVDAEAGMELRRWYQQEGDATGEPVWEDDPRCQ